MKKRMLGIVVLGMFIIFSNIPAIYAQKATSTGKMKFLVISERKDIYFALPQEEQKKIEAASDKYLKQVLAAGDFLKFYNIPGWNRAVSIEQYENIEALYKHFEEDPYYGYVNFEVYPLYETEMDDEIAAKAKSDSKKMKFLVINEAKDIYYTLPADERGKIDEESPFHPGDLLKIHSIPGWNRAVAIEQYDSIESLYNHFEEDSYYPYANFEVYPLVEVDLTE